MKQMNERDLGPHKLLINEMYMYASAVSQRNNVRRKSQGWSDCAKLLSAYSSIHCYASKHSKCDDCNGRWPVRLSPTPLLAKSKLTTNGWSISVEYPRSHSQT